MRFIDIGNEMNYSLFCDYVRGKKLFLHGDFDTIPQAFARYLYDKEVSSVIVDSIAAEEKTFMGVNLLAVDDLKEALLKDSAILVCGKPFSKILRRLAALQAAPVFTVDKINSFVSDFFKYESQISQVRSILSDEKSRYIFDSILNKRMDYIGEYFDIGEPNQYFNDVFADVITETETYLDLGAFDLHTIASFVAYTKNKYKKIYAFEPTQSNYQDIKQALAKNPKIEVLPYAVSNTNDNLMFYNFPDEFYASNNTLFHQEDTNEKNDANGNNYETVKSITIDSYFNEEITFIKMDIEGAEKVALMGAENTILKYKPKLAVCVYHMVLDILEIPLYLHALVPEYKFFLRHHSGGIWETVLYAYI